MGCVPGIFYGHVYVYVAFPFVVIVTFLSHVVMAMFLWPIFHVVMCPLFCEQKKFFANKKNYILAVGVGVCTLLLCGRRLDLQQGNEINVWLGGKIFISSINFF